LCWFLTGAGLTSGQATGAVQAYCGGTTCPLPYTCSGYGSGSCTSAFMTTLFHNITTAKAGFCSLAQGAATAVSQCAGYNCNTNITQLCTTAPSISANPSGTPTCSKSTHKCASCSGTAGSDLTNSGDASSSNPACAFYSGFQLMQQVCKVNSTYPSVPVTCQSLLNYVAPSAGTVHYASMISLLLIGVLSILF